MDLFSDLLRRVGFDVTGLANRLKRVFGVAMVVEGRRIPVVLLSGATSASAPHGLGRAYLGALVETQSASLTGLRVNTPGTDAATLVTISVSAAPASDVALNLWVY